MTENVLEESSDISVVPEQEVDKNATVDNLKDQLQNNTNRLGDNKNQRDRIGKEVNDTIGHVFKLIGDKASHLKGEDAKVYYEQRNAHQPRMTSTTRE